MATDRQDPSNLLSDIDNDLNNGVPNNSITPEKHNTLLSDALKTACFFGEVKFNLKDEGDPTAGQISLVAKEFDTASELKISKSSAHTNDISKLLGTVQGGGVIHIKTFDGAIFGEFLVTGVSDDPTFITVNVTPNSSNPNYTPGATPIEVSVQFFAKSDSVNIMNADLTMIGKRIQDFNGDIMTFNNGFLKLGSNFKIYIDDMRDLGNTGAVLNVDLEAGGDAMEVIVNSNFTINFSNLLIGSGYINLNIGAPGNFVMTSGALTEWAAGSDQDITLTSGAKDRLYWTCDGAAVELKLSKDIS